jgi:beta-aspartyl-dipeptidase (metallo-type)
VRAALAEAIALARRGCTVDITAFPVAEGEDAWPADEALLRYLASGAPADRVTIRSDGGGCLPTFDADGRVAQMDVGASTALAATLRTLLDRGEPLARVLPAFTSNVATLCGCRERASLPPARMRIWWCSMRRDRWPT